MVLKKILFMTFSFILFERNNWFYNTFINTYTLTLKINNRLLNLILKFLFTLISHKFHFISWQKTKYKFVMPVDLYDNENRVSLKLIHLVYLTTKWFTMLSQIVPRQESIRILRLSILPGYIIILSS